MLRSDRLLWIARLLWSDWLLKIARLLWHGRLLRVARLLGSDRLLRVARPWRRDRLWRHDWLPRRGGNQAKQANRLGLALGATKRLRGPHQLEAAFTAAKGVHR